MSSTQHRPSAANTLRFPNSEAYQSNGASNQNSTSSKKTSAHTFGNKLSQLMSLYDGSELRQAELKTEFSRQLDTCNNIVQLEKGVLEINNYLGFSGYSLVRLEAVEGISGTQALSLRALLTSYRGEAPYHNGALLQASVANTRNKHLSVIYHFIANAPFDTQLLDGKPVLLLLSCAGQCDYQLTLDGAYKGHNYTSPIEDITLFYGKTDSSDSGPILKLLIEAVKEIGTSKFYDYFEPEKKSSAVSINHKPLQLLNVMAHRDTTLNQAAEILNISIDTANKHIAAAKSALGTKTLPGTIWKAMQKGLIDQYTS